MEESRYCPLFERISNLDQSPGVPFPYCIHSASSPLHADGTRLAIPEDETSLPR